MTGILVCFSVAMVKYQNSLWGWLFGSQVTVHQGKQEKNLGQGPGARHSKQRPQRGACSSCLTLPAFLYILGPPTQGRHPHRELGLLHQSLINQSRKCPQACLQADYGGIFSVEVPSSHMALACVTWTKLTIPGKFHS